MSLFARSWMFILIDVYNSIVNFLCYIWNINKHIRTYILDGEIVFVGAMSTSGDFTVLLNLENANIYTILYHMYSMYISTKPYPYIHNVSPKDIKYYVFRYYKEKKVYTYLHTTFALSISKRVAPNELMYAFLHINGNPIYVLDIINSIIDEKDNIKVTVAELADIVTNIYMKQETPSTYDYSTASTLKLHICDMNTMTEQIFKANDVINI